MPLGCLTIRIGGALVAITSIDQLGGRRTTVLAVPDIVLRARVAIKLFSGCDCKGIRGGMDSCVCRRNKLRIRDVRYWELGPMEPGWGENPRFGDSPMWGFIASLRSELRV